MVGGRRHQMDVSRRHSAPAARQLRLRSGQARRPLSSWPAATAPCSQPTGGTCCLRGRLAPRRAGLLRVTPAGVIFSHPLVRAAILAGSDVGERMAGNRALAGVLEDDRRAWHLAALAAGPDEEIATGLDTAAQRAGQRGSRAAPSSVPLGCPADSPTRWPSSPSRRSIRASCWTPRPASRRACAWPLIPGRLPSPATSPAWRQSWPRPPATRRPAESASTRYGTCRPARQAGR